jgi:hypothetical protein
MFPALLQHLATADQGEITNAKYPPAFFPTLMGSLPNQVYAALAWSFLLHLTANITVSDSLERPTPSVTPSVEIKAAAAYLSAFLGKPDPHNDTWDQLVSEVILARSKGREDAKGMEARGRVVVAWVGLGGDSAISAFLDRLIEVWTDAKEIRFGLFGRLRCGCLQAHAERSGRLAHYSVLPQISPSSSSLRSLFFPSAIPSSSDWHFMVHC